MFKVDSLIEIPDELQQKRVEQLAGLYETRIEAEISPFDDGSADLQKFLDSQKGV